MAVELILLEDVEGVGQIGDLIRVAEGHARNYLLPKNLAVQATPGNMRRLEARKRQIEKEHAERLGVAQGLAEKIRTTSVTVTAKAAENDELYGSVGVSQIVAALVEVGIEIERNALMLPEPIHKLGIYEVEIKLHTEVLTTLKVWVVRD